MSTVSGVSNSSNVWAALNTQRNPQQAKMFAKVDADGSGGVDQAELDTLVSEVSQKMGVHLGDSRALFETMDSNTDGSLSGEELGQGMNDLMPPPPSTVEFAQSRGAAGEAGDDDLFAKLDTDSDGSVSADELKVLTDKVAADTGQDVSNRFAELDSDGDGALSQTEFEAGRPQAPDGAGGSQKPGGPPPAGGPGGPGGTGGAKSASTDTTYDALDTNKDGTVSELERLAGALKELAQAASADSSGDSTQSQGNLEIARLAQKLYDQISTQWLGKDGESQFSATA